MPDSRAQPVVISPPPRHLVLWRRFAGYSRVASMGTLVAAGRPSLPIAWTDASAISSLGGDLVAGYIADGSMVTLVVQKLMLHARRACVPIQMDAHASRPRDP